MDGLIKIFNDIQTEEWTDYEILKDFTENEQTRFCYDWDGLDYERVLPAITNILKENQQLKKQNDDVVEYIKYQLSNLDFKKDEDMKAKMLGSMIIVMLEDNGMLGEIDEIR